MSCIQDCVGVFLNSVFFHEEPDTRYSAPSKIIFCISYFLCICIFSGPAGQEAAMCSIEHCPALHRVTLHNSPSFALYFCISVFLYFCIFEFLYFYISAGAAVCSIEHCPELPSPSFAVHSSRGSVHLLLAQNCTKLLQLFFFCFAAPAIQLCIVLFFFFLLCH